MMGTVSAKRIWVISEVFYPEQISTGYIMTEIAKALAESTSETEVHVICGPASYEKGQKSMGNDADLPQLKFHRVTWFNFSKNKLLLRTLRLLGISLCMFLKGMWLIRRNDRVLMVTNPAPMIPLIALMRRLKGFRLSILVHDIFPENLLVGNILHERSIVYKVLKWLYDKSYKAAATLIVLGRDMQEVMERKTGFTPDRVPIIPNWADPEVQPQPAAENVMLQRAGLVDKIVVLYAGNHGRLQHLPEFLELAAEVRNELVHFVFAGSGAVKQQMMEYAREKGLQRVHFWDAFSRAEQNVYLNAGHIGLVTLSDRLYGLGVPSKTYNILACGKPVLFVGNKNTEIAKMVTEQACGYVFAYEERQALLHFLNSLNSDEIPVLNAMGARGLSAAQSTYTKKAVLEQFQQLFN
jgi:glycosyltransferase involved in cell wall biosynthesis